MAQVLQIVGQRGLHYQPLDGSDKQGGCSLGLYLWCNFAQHLARVNTGAQK